VPQREPDLDVCVEVNFFSHCFDRSASRNQTKRSKQQKYGIRPKSYPKTKEAAQYPRLLRRLFLPTQGQRALPVLDRTHCDTHAVSGGSRR